MSDRLRTFLTMLALVPPALALAYSVFAMSGPGIVGAPAGVVALLALFSPFWVPFTFLAYAIRLGEFRFSVLFAFVAVEVLSILACNQAARLLSD